MKVAVINEVSARDKNPAVVAALQAQGAQVVNAGMTAGAYEVELTYIHTGFMAGALLNLGAVDMVVGGCGTGQGFLLSAMQYPGVFAGLITEPLDAFLFSQINAGNCVSLALNKGYGWAGDVNLSYLFQRLFEREPGQGYPQTRSESQQRSRELLRALSAQTHRRFSDILDSIAPEILRTAMRHEPFARLVRGECADRQLQQRLIERALTH